MPNTSSLTQAQRTFRERSTGDYECILLDEDGVAVALADLDTITLTLRDIESGTIINSRTNQNVKNLANVTIHATTGLLTWVLQIADNAIVNATLANGGQEIHRALFKYTWSGGTKFDSHEIILTIIALDDVP